MRHYLRGDRGALLPHAVTVIAARQAIPSTVPPIIRDAVAISEVLMGKGRRKGCDGPAQVRDRLGGARWVKGVDRAELVAGA